MVFKSDSMLFYSWIFFILQYLTDLTIMLYMDFFLRAAQHFTI